MYWRENRYQLSFEDFFLPFGGKLSGDNRLIKLNGVPASGVTRGISPGVAGADGSPPSPFSCGNGWAGL